jgi:hypothetical protein
MPKTAGNILKSDEVKLEGQFRLNVAQAGYQPGGPEEQSPDLAVSKVRILENNPEFADIEITCSCGRKTNVKCEYTGVQAPDKVIENNQINGEKQNAD